MKEIMLFVDFEFTSLSPDAQLISLGIVSEDVLPSTVSIKTIPLEKLPFHTQEKIKELMHIKAHQDESYLHPKEVLITDFMKANDPTQGIIRGMDVSFTEVKSPSIK